jgi:hypothetical protein
VRLFLQRFPAGGARLTRPPARRWGILYMAQMNPLINPILGE